MCANQNWYSEGGNPKHRFKNQVDSKVAIDFLGYLQAKRDKNFCYKRPVSRQFDTTSNFSFEEELSKVVNKKVNKISRGSQKILSAKKVKDPSWEYRKLSLVSGFNPYLSTDQCITDRVIDNKSIKGQVDIGNHVRSTRVFLLIYLL